MNRQIRPRTAIRDMNDRVMAAVMALVSSALLFPVAAGAASDEARVTRIVRDVKLLPSQAKPKPAVLNEKVSNGTGVRTGDASRSELTFADLTIERLGSNTVFSFNGAGRNVRLDSGSILMRVPKDSGGANMSTKAVTVGITGTTLILEAGRRNRLTVLEGGARVSLNKNRSQSVYVRGGQMEDIPAGATTLPPPVNVNLSDIMKTNPLITDFGPLPSRDLIMATASNPPVYQGKPPDNEPPPSGPGILPSILPTLIGVGLGPLSGGGGGGGSHPHANTHTHTKNPGTTHTAKPTTGGNAGGTKTIGHTNRPKNPATKDAVNPKTRKKKTATPN